MKVTIENKEIELKSSFRSHIYYEEITGETFAPSSTKNIICYFYATVMASDKDLSIDFDDFVDWLDENPEELKNFADWLVKVSSVTSQTQRDGETAEPDKKKE